MIVKIEPSSKHDAEFNLERNVEPPCLGAYNPRVNSCVTCGFQSTCVNKMNRNKNGNYVIKTVEALMQGKVYTCDQIRQGLIARGLDEGEAELILLRLLNHPSTASDADGVNVILRKP